MAEAKNWAIGMDLGGTKLAAAIVSAEGDLLHQAAIPSRGDLGVDAVINRINRLLDSLLETAAADGMEVVGVGLAAGGCINPETGMVVSATNVIPGWSGVNLKEAVDTPGPVLVGNDVNLAALGECLLGGEAPGGAPSVLALVAVGTGIGAGVIVDRNIYYGSRWRGADFGHVNVVPDGRPCLCGGKGCLEAYSSGWAIAGRYRELSGDAGDAAVDAGLVISRAGEGDEVALKVVREAEDFLAQALANLVTIIDPEVLVLTGGVIDRNPPIFDKVNRDLWRYLPPYRDKELQVKPSRFGGWAGVVGAACLVFRQAGIM